MSASNYHKVKCRICQSDKCNRLNEDYLHGYTQAEIAKEYGFERETIVRHVRALELDKRRDNSTLAIVNRIVQGIDWKSLPVKTLRNAIELMNLRSKLLGEVVQKHEYKEILDELPSEQLEQLAQRSQHIIDERLAETEDTGDRQTSVPS